MCEYKIIPFTDPLEVGTRIHWDEPTQSAYFVDLPQGTVFKYDAKDQRLTRAKVANEPLAFMFPVEGSDTKFIAGLGRKFAFVEWDGEATVASNIEVITEIENEPGVRENRLNGAKVDPYGRLWAGTMGPTVDGETVPHKGSLYSLEKGVVKKHKCHISISNGLAWNLDKMKMYYCDTLDPKIYQYDFSFEGEITNEKVVFEYGPNKLEGKPDGLTIDRDGCLWSCSIFGSTIVRFDPEDGTIKDKIVFPVSQVTAVTFGGKCLNDLFVTTARIPVDRKIPPYPAGSTYIIKNVRSIGFKGDRYKP